MHYKLLPVFVPANRFLAFFGPGGKEQNRRVGAAQNFFGYASDDPAFYPGATIRRHDDEINRMSARAVEDRFRGRTEFGHRVDRNLSPIGALGNGSQVAHPPVPTARCPVHQEAVSGARPWAGLPSLRGVWRELRTKPARINVAVSTIANPRNTHFLLFMFNVGAPSPQSAFRGVPPNCTERDGARLPAQS